MIIDEETGEIYDYEVVKYEHAEEAQPLLFLCDVKSMDDMDDFMKVMVDRRKIRGSNTDDLLRFFEGCLSNEILDKEFFHAEETMTTTQYRILRTLCDMVQYRNVFITTQEELCRRLGCVQNNLKRKLRQVEPYINTYTSRDGIRRGEIKVEVNPKFVYICEMGYYDMSRNKAIDEWFYIKITKN
ncbi:MAG: hypothetical protein CMF22_10300 [Idiomarinaceae bacterium]|nr:hypothetical protein [Idiomarinaceae bacterium]MBG23831.1 hypothetical protein [Idiomarinaceae bacterium]|tara:strand:- start:30733 stop:31287 length:555 start_codon:yes stop_codon:yes gene_type:complete